MEQRKQMRRLSRSSLLIAGAFLILLIYIAGVFAVFLNGRSIDQIKAGSSTQPTVRSSVYHDAVFFRELGRKSEHSKHQRNAPDVDNLFQLAVQKAPADHANLLAYGMHLATRKCCHAKTINLLTEAVKRKPQDPSIYEMAGNALLQTGDREQALKFFQKALELDGSFGHEIYSILQRQGSSITDLRLITPGKNSSQVLLSSYVVGRGHYKKQDLEDLWQDLLEMPLEPQQRILVAKNAFRAGDFHWARVHAMKALEKGASQADAMTVIADISLKQKDWVEFARVTESVENYYRRTEGDAKAATYALQSAKRFSSSGSLAAQAKTKRVIQNYPDFAPAYVQMAELEKRDSEHSALSHLRNAVRLEPENFEYNSLLAKQYLSMSMVLEAEEIYRRFSKKPEFTEQAYMGLSSCKLKSGNLYEAIFILQEGIRYAGKSPILLRQLGLSYEAVKEYKKAAEIYHEYAMVAPRKSLAILMIAQMYEKAGHLDAAQKEYQNVLELDPENRQAKKALSKLNRTHR